MMTGEPHVCENLPIMSKWLSYESRINGQRSCLEHFIVSDNLYDSVLKCSVLHDCDIMSDHYIVFITLCLNLNVNHKLIDIEDIIKLLWWKATNCDIDNYMSQLNQLLHVINIPNHSVLFDIRWKNLIPISPRIETCNM